jgi:hypothetical protein
MLLGLKMNYNFNETDEVNEFEVNWDSIVVKVNNLEKELNKKEIVNLIQKNFVINKESDKFNINYNKATLSFSKVDHKKI